MGTLQKYMAQALGKASFRDAWRAGGWKMLYDGNLACVLAGWVPAVCCSLRSPPALRLPGLRLRVFLAAAEVGAGLAGLLAAALRLPAAVTLHFSLPFKHSLRPLAAVPSAFALPDDCMCLVNSLEQ